MQPCFAMTINKTQAQQTVGQHLTRTIFTHSMLYITLS